MNNPPKWMLIENVKGFEAKKKPLAFKNLVDARKILFYIPCSSYDQPFVDTKDVIAELTTSMKIKSIKDYLRNDVDLNEDKRYLVPDKASQVFNQISQKANSFPIPFPTLSSTQEILTILATLKLRYFTEYEISSIMGFPEEFSFPPEVSLKQRYKVLGNSINVKVVAELIKYLLLDKE
ncbi:10925_t:CDS:2 [Acaulospora colombiana]|uniref:10925_t:CDS:1 n=1 Tax=Acaulospora colombiana TaxID=27376 RepID=A0ACA9LLI8_9GLOM|nr:10925_t:CDS:2 [Acaulospora colombiana]